MLRPQQQWSWFLAVIIIGSHFIVCTHGTFGPQNNMVINARISGTLGDVGPTDAQEKNSSLSQLVRMLTSSSTLDTFGAVGIIEKLVGSSSSGSG